MQPNESASHPPAAGPAPESGAAPAWNPAAGWNESQAAWAQPAMPGQPWPAQAWPAPAGVYPQPGYAPPGYAQPAYPQPIPAQPVAPQPAPQTHSAWSPAQAIADVVALVQRQEGSFQSAKRDIESAFDRLKQLATEILPLQRAAQPAPAPIPAPTPIPVAAAPSGDLDAIIFGPDLAADYSIAGGRRALIEGLMQGDSVATNLIGTLLVFRSSSAERMPQWLKDIGEAWFRWRPNSSDAPDGVRDALIAYLEKTCANNGVPNTIELVRRGDRYEATRHNAKERGIEVADVFGWIVLRDNGKVYTKANVSVR